VPTRSGDIRDQSRKLSEIAPKFGRLFDPPKFYGAGLPKIVRTLSPMFATRRLEKSHEDINTNAEVIWVHTLNFKANFKFSRLEFFGGTPVPVRVCAR